MFIEDQYMKRALELAAQGAGNVEPNPMVGAVIVRDNMTVGEGYHQRFGGPHAEVLALEQAGSYAKGGTLYVTLEPCCHQGKTPPCTDAIIKAGIRRVVVGLLDPFPSVNGSGLAKLNAAGMLVEAGLLQDRLEKFYAPYFHRLATGRPWVMAKWAMTLDGKIATASGESKWITGEKVRNHLQLTRSRVDAIIVGIGTALADDPLLTARPPGPRLATRIILDHYARLPATSQLAKTAREAPVLVVHGPNAPAERIQALESLGIECWQAPAGKEPLEALLTDLGTRRQFTNVLVEGGAAVLGSFFAAELVNEIHVSIAPKILGGTAALSPIGGAGAPTLAKAIPVATWAAELVGADLLWIGRIKGPAA